jgi:hypothetical protein
LTNEAASYESSLISAMLNRWFGKEAIISAGCLFTISPDNAPCARLALVAHQGEGYSWERNPNRRTAGH